MQIHELNTFSGKPGETDYLAIDSGFDTAKISGAKLLEPKVNRPIDENNQYDNGEAGQILRSKGDGSTEWSDVGNPTDAQTAQAVSDWLDAHPEATTTVQDGSLTEAKFSNSLKELTIKDYVTPEMYGAVGDGVTDDIQAIIDCLNSGAKHFVFSKKYYISTPINNVPNSSLIEGKGTIQAATTAFELDAIRGVMIRDLTINYSLYGLHITSTGGYADYCDFENLTLNGSDNTTSIGVYLERTTSFLNELRFTNVICWNQLIGFKIYNPNTNIECASHRFLFCSAESSGQCAFYLENSSFDSWIFSRIAEGNGALFESVGTCQHLTIISEHLYLQKEQPLSSGTSGVVLGCLRSGLLYGWNPGGYASIIDGKIIPCESLLSRGVESQNLNSDQNAPYFNASNYIFIYNCWHKYGASETNLNLDKAYYGGSGKINTLYIYTGQGAGAINIKWDNKTFVIPQDNQTGNSYEIKYFFINGNGFWRYTKLNSFS